MTSPRVAAKQPVQINLEKCEHYWCACGHSKSQPFCDGSHEGTDFTPYSYTAEKDRTLYFCGCKQTKGVPLCDGSHNAL